MNYRNVIVSLSEGLLQLHFEKYRDSITLEATEIADEISDNVFLVHGAQNVEPHLDDKKKQPSRRGRRK